MTELPDVTDPDIRAMVLRDHQPEEVWLDTGRLISVHCSACYADWPCPSIKAARDAEPELPIGEVEWSQDSWRRRRR